MKNKHFDHFVTSAIAYLFRQASMGHRLVIAGVLLALGIAGANVDLTFPFRGEQLSFSYSSLSEIGPLEYVFAALATLLVLVGLFIVILDRREQAKSRIYVIEMRGLTDWNGAALVDAVGLPKGRKEAMVIDLRQRIKENLILEPKQAIDRLWSHKVVLQGLETSKDRTHINFVYGGISPVPLTFLAGAIFDDETTIEVFDWDRHGQRWRALDELDDSKRFNVEGLTPQLRSHSEVVLAVSVSYKVDIQGINRALPCVPVVHMEIEGSGPDLHWSQVKQTELGKQFLNVLISLCGLGVGRIHLFMAGPNSLVFQFGRLYDKRNLPALLVYQYQRELDPPYPWAVKMPVAGSDAPELVLR